MDAASAHRAGFVTLAGRSNVGKSTLLNRLVGQKVAIVTPLPQTTRRRVLGIRSDPDAQVIFVDTPGIHEPKSPLNRRMVETARRCLNEGDVIAAVVEAAPELDRGDRRVLDEVRALGTPKVVVINKIDRVARPALLALADQCARMMPETEVVPVSALTGENVDELMRTLKRMLRAAPALMPEDEYTDQSERALVEEVVREKIFLTMRQEVPFSTAVKVESFAADPERRLLRIAAVIIVDRDSHKGMLIGAGGRTLKAIGTAARLALEEILGARLFLQLFVKVERNWTRDPRKLAELGL